MFNVFKNLLKILDNKKRGLLDLFFMVSTGGLEPPQLAPHAPQACMSTIPSHRHINFIQFFIVTPNTVCAGSCLRQPSPWKIFNLPRRQSITSTYYFFNKKIISQIFYFVNLNFIFLRVIM